MRRSSVRRRSRRGSIVVLAAFFLVALIGMVAFAVDCGMISLTRSELHRTADAAAMAAAGALYDRDGELDIDTAYEAAVSAGVWNHSGAVGVRVEDQDIVVGIFDFETRTVTPDDVEPNAVQIFTHRRADRGNSLKTFFAPVLGVVDANIGAVATAYLPPVTRTRGVPMALRAPSFGPVDPKVAEKNPGKDGPSYPLNDSYFEEGEKVTLLTYGKGKKPTVHLSLQTEVESVPVDKEITQQMLTGARDAPWMQIGDEYYVHNEGSGSSSLPGSLDDRLGAPSHDELRDLTLPVVEVIPSSRNADGYLAGKVRIVDFVSVHLDGIEEYEVPDPAKPSRMISMEVLVGTVTKRRVTTMPVPFDDPLPSGVGGGSLFSTAFLVE